MPITRGSKILSIHLTDLCNERCIFCVVGTPERKQEGVLLSKIKTIILQNMDSGWEAVNLHGGEPTVHPAFVDILKLIRDCGYPEVQLQTNGRRLSDPGFVRTLRDLNVNLFIVSMHGMDARVHESLTRARGGFNQTVKGIKNVKEAGGRLRTNTVVTKQNMSTLPAMMDWLADLGVDHINISNLHPVETAYLHFDLVAPTVEETGTWVPLAVQRAVARDVPITLEGFPMCTVPGCEAYHVGRRDGKIGMEVRDLWINDYDLFMDQVCRTKGEECTTCKLNPACGGVYKEYIEKRGWSEFHAF